MTYSTTTGKFSLFFSLLFPFLALEPAGRASELAGRALDPIKKASEQVRRASKEVLGGPRIKLGELWS